MSRPEMKMKSLLEIVLIFCDNFPIVSIVMIVICIFSSIPVMILFIAIQRAAVHDNCRVLISFWAICLLLILVNVSMLYGHTFTFVDGFLPRGMISPPARPWLLCIHGAVYTSSSLLEMCIVLERILSTRKPHIYHESDRATKTLTIAICVALILGSGNGYLLYIIGLHESGLFVHNLLDFLTLIVNTIGIRYTKGRFDALYAKATLNARYQVKEAYTMAQAMNPVYLGSFLLKFSATGVGYIYAIFVCCSDVRYYEILDCAYFILHIVNCVFSSSLLISKHESIRKSARSLLISEKARSSTRIINGTRSTDTVNTYFTMLDQSWR